MSALPRAADEMYERLALDRPEEIAAALRAASQHLRATQADGDPSSIAAALVGLGRLRFRLGQYETARSLGEQALGLAAPDAPAGVNALQLLGNCAAEVWSPLEAESHYRRAAEWAREIGYQRARAAALHGLAAGVYLPRGWFDLALATDGETYTIAVQQGEEDWRIYPLVTITIAYLSTARHECARATLHELATLVAPGSVADGYRICLDADLALDEGDSDAAITGYQQARVIAESSGEPWLNMAVRLGTCRAHRLADRYAEASTWAEDALAFGMRVGCRHEQGKALIERGRTAWLRGDIAPAEADLRHAIRILDDLGAGFDLARARFLLAALLHSQGQEVALQAWLAAARTIIKGGYAFLLEQERLLAFPMIASYASGADVSASQASDRLLDHLQRVPPPPLHLKLLGRLEIRQGRRQIDAAALRSRRAGELLTLLTLASDHVLSTEQVAEALWPGRSSAAARITLHHATSALRRALEPELPGKFPSRYLEVDEGQVSLHLPQGSTIDVERFEAHCHRGAWEEAVACYRGPLLPEIPYADWAMTTRERLGALYQRALVEASRVWLATDRYQQALEACEALLVIEPWHEQAALLAMQAAVGLTDTARARRIYLTIEKTLKDELGTIPQTELHTYYHSITPTAHRS